MHNMYNNFKKNKAGKKQYLASLYEVRLRIIQLTLLFTISFLSWGSTYAETLISQQQNNTITGTVTDNSGESLVGVTVQIKGTTLGTVTDVDGRYILTNLSDDAILVFSYVGFLTEEYAIDGKSTLDVIMMPNIETLGEFVVIGYGVQRKLDVTSSISTINVDDLKSTPTISTESYLQGRAAGIFVASNTGAPGSTISVKIRGMVTTGNSEPLYIVDGMPMASGGGDNKFGINSLNPNDIESIQILKDASSSAIYGSRGSNGVVLITTKRGQSGKPTINLNTYYGFQSQARRIDVLNKEQYKTYYDLLGSSAPQYDDFDDPNLFAALPDFDWQNEIFTTAPTANAQLSVSGGSENSTYLISMGNTNQEGLVQGSNFNRTNLRINSDHKITNWLKFGESLSISYFRRNRIKEGGVGYSFPTAPPIIAALLSDPTTEAYDEDGNWNYMRHSGSFNGAGLRDRSSYLYTNKKLNGNLFFEITPFEGLLFKSSFGLDYNLGETREFMPSFSVEGSNLNEGQVAPTLKQSDAHGTYMITEQTLNYNKTLGIIISISWVVSRLK
jgi:TonB-dependent starch-binding outer membrane protein SusC